MLQAKRIERLSHLEVILAVYFELLALYVPEYTPLPEPESKGKSSGQDRFLEYDLNTPGRS